MYPVVFIGHGSPMNAIEENEITDGWKKLAASLPKPKAIVVISAHWETQGTKVLSQEHPKTIYDFYGFPKELYEIVYKAISPKPLRDRVHQLLATSSWDESWGWDHGTWSVLHIMYPEANIPVAQISIDHFATPQELYDIGKALQALREEGVMILGSGNIVHNLRLASFHVSKGYDWALEFDEFIHQNILQRNHASILAYQKLGRVAQLAVPTAEHFNPLLYVLGATTKDDEVKVYNRFNFAGSVSMTSYVFYSGKVTKLD